ncbi:hypothetical protein MUP77_04415 [Candidatus Bathyarchaeota archaeon]|nr:hypothetical protein [Candidatus Bathyarchaeota archaeon]
MRELSISLRSIRGLKIAIIAGATLLFAGLLGHFYLITDPNPQWWSANYPWMSFATLSILFAGGLTSTVGTSLAFLETFIFLDQEFTSRADKIETVLKKLGPNPRKERVRESKPVAHLPLRTQLDNRAIVVPAD